MKRLFVVLIAVFGLSLTGFSQGTLQFNDVKLFTWANTINSPYLSAVYTVPAGKVWKIESAGSNNNVSIFQINGQYTSQSINSGGTSTGADNLPIWLPAGATIQFSGSYSSSGLGGYVSILEFNVVP